MLLCNIPFARAGQPSGSIGLARVFQVLNRKKEERLIETYSLTQTSLEQIFVQLAGEDEDSIDDREIKADGIAGPVIVSHSSSIRPTELPMMF